MFYSGVNFKEHLSSHFFYYSLSPILILENTATKIFANIKYPITQCMESVVRYCRSKPSFKWNSIAVWLTIKKVGQKLFLKKTDIFIFVTAFYSYKLSILLGYKISKQDSKNKQLYKLLSIQKTNQPLLIRFLLYAPTSDTS